MAMQGQQHCELIVHHGVETGSSRPGSAPQFFTPLHSISASRSHAQSQGNTQTDIICLRSDFTPYLLREWHKGSLPVGDSSKTTLASYTPVQS
eukprot:CAMPEP_0204539608 /NCGR_PEP_ID=MMETSP0661-20131031/16865_1 /ASSEMBLY_ACC=CAM_ASM_000606 /TAXON_ID=109239 /ORGANISM="Alexandrium margalefi, Strain AMGDE01CS-322" /LENGTH=92 /DNA_ID=CAMNT_0051546227 /DNA_START=99 /DNA_END=374 /DNA_ORIENTATION=-